MVEVQIRTHEMHEIAEYGAAAEHWRYKEEKAYRKGRISRVAKEKDQIWSRQLAEMRKNWEQEQASTAPTALKQWIYVITPEGHVIDLRAGATPLDFAYRIHTELGHRYMGAKVDAHIVRLDYRLKNGEIVELITSRARSGPSPDWLSRSKDENGNSNYVFVRTSQARGKIRAWFNEHNPKEKEQAHKLKE
jgi:GTP pyrophosphokinase